MSKLAVVVVWIVAGCTSPATEASKEPVLEPGGIAFRINGVPAITTKQPRDTDRTHHGYYIPEERRLALELHGNTHGQNRGELYLQIESTAPTLGTHVVRRARFSMPLHGDHAIYFGPTVGTLKLTTLVPLPAETEPRGRAGLQRWEVSGTFEVEIPVDPLFNVDRPPIQITRGRFERIELRQVKPLPKSN